MIKQLYSLAIIPLIIFISCLSLAQESSEGRGYYDLGVFSYEEGNYTDAEINLLNALDLNPDNPLYNHYMGRVYIEMERYDEAMTHLMRAWEGDPLISGLKYDMALVNYRKGDYGEAADLYEEVTEEEPDNVLAHYQAGISLYKETQYGKALSYFMTASDKSPTIKANGYYYAGICYLKMGDMDNALEKLEYAVDHSDSEVIRESALKWLDAIESRKKALRPYDIFAKVGYRDDSNVRLEPEDEDRFADEGDRVTVGYFSGKYNVINRLDWVAGLGYRHYETMHKDLDTYDLRNSTFSVYGKYNKGAVSLSLSYLPHFYWLDSDKYIRKDQLKTEVTYRFEEPITTRLSYSYYSNDHIQDNDRDGHSNELFLNTYYTIGSSLGYLYGGVGYEDRSTTHPDHYYDQYSLRAGISVNVAWSMNLKLNLKYSDRGYDNIDSRYLVKRADKKYDGSLSLSKGLFCDWLSIMGEFDYTRRDSNISDYRYKRNLTTLSLIARF